MKIIGFIWLEQFVEKLFVKHGVETDEVEDVFYNQPRIEKAGSGKVLSLEPNHVTDGFSN